MKRKKKEGKVVASLMAEIFDHLPHLKPKVSDKLAVPRANLMFWITKQYHVQLF